MNQAAKDALRQAWLEGVRQIKGQLVDYAGGFCARGVLINRGIPGDRELWGRRVSGCPEQATCGGTEHRVPIAGTARVTRTRITANLAGRMVEAFLCGQSFAHLGRRFRVARSRVEAAVRRHARRRRRR